MNTIDFVQSDLCDLACHQGVTFSVDLLCTQGCSNAPDDLHGYSATMLVYDADVDDDIATITGTITDPSSGEINFSMSATTTAALDVGMYNYFIDLVIGATVYRIAGGKFEVLE